MGHELRVVVRIHPGQLMRTNPTLAQSCSCLPFWVGMLGAGGRERGGVEVQLWVAITQLGCAISPCWTDGSELPLDHPLLWGLLWVFLLLWLLFKVLGNNLEGIQNLFLQACLCLGIKNTHMQSRKRKDKLNSFSGGGVQK